MAILGISATITGAVCFDHKKVSIIDIKGIKKKVKAVESSPRPHLMISKIQKALNKRMRGAVITYRRSGLKLAFEGAIRKAVKRFIK